ncbi:phosphoribosylformylglycinamidine synthase subunit PurL [Chondromyces apiculatus]|uniref:Phosphoribosylformylglycinamidine synthase subunit PurL n=1 Tax=Chondromyces apiculatus DSM 436 TaxID=1192034 RepID=A0A017T2A2_9BACT|nr:phosphoribosylformylglycinamidine synthase subunit PurL [Chondromyces apiculatus]EYF02671.1 Phosphoribosylformylglycinamidine synthase, synthetase subunit [Chondromyces apiculatus DSM 436]
MSTDVKATVPSPAPFPGDPAVDLALARSHKLSAEEWARACAHLGREPQFAELGVISVMWSEHCSYKSSRVHLGRLPTTGPRVIQGPGENAGVVDIGDGFAAVFKMESHNHPSFIEPYQGAATGVGGILRDVFTMGARPIANLDSLRFGRPDHPRTAALLRGVVAGVGGYGNCIGVPTVGGELSFDKAYDGNILVNAFTCGVVRADRIFYGRASGVGNPVIYVGARTGRDGIHGATMASDEFSAEGPSKRPTVQVGDPFMEKLLLEACLEIFAEDLLVGIQDMGAAGLTSSSVEMAGRSGSGLLLDLDRVPRRAKGLTPYEMLLSESQERMLLVAKPGCEARVEEICRKWELEAAIIGQVTDTGRWVIQATPGYDPLADAPIARAPVTVCDLPVDFLTDAAPKYDRPQREDAGLPGRRAFDAATIAAPQSWSAELLAMAGSPNLGSRQWVWRQYDHIVRGGTEVRPGSDAAVVRVPCERDGVRVEKLLAFAVDCNGRLCELDAFQGAAMAIAEVCRNVVCGGAEPVGITDCLNFGNPERPEIMRQFAQAIDGMAAACKALGVPIVSGNVSLYNETDGRAILPTPTVGAVGLVRDAGDVTRAGFPEAGLSVLLLGGRRGGPLGGSEYVVRHTGEVQGEPPGIDLAAEVRLQAVLLELLRARPRHVLSAHDVSEGGLAIALAECCAAVDDPARMVGAMVSLPEEDEGLAAGLFGEAPGRVVVTVRPGDEAEVARIAGAGGVGVTLLGSTGGGRLSIARQGALLVDVGLAELREARERCLEAIVGR